MLHDIQIKSTYWIQRHLSLLQNLSFIVFFVFVILLGWWVIVLFLAGEQLIGSLSGLIGLASALNPVISFFDPSDRVEQSSRILMRLMVGLILVLVVIVARTFINPELARQRVEEGVRVTDITVARQNLDIAQRLGSDIEPALRNEINQVIDSPIGSEGDQSVVRLAELYRLFGKKNVDWYQTLETNIREGIQMANNVRASRSSMVLALAAPDKAIDLVKNLNDEFVKAQGNHDFNKAGDFIQAISFLEGGLGDSRSVCSRSVTQMNLGIFFDASPGFEDYLSRAQQSYSNAVQLDDSNVQAHYLLSSFLLVNYAEDSVQLERAVAIAHNARLRYLSGQPLNTCALERGDTPELLDWYRFLLLTTEAGARLALKDAPITIGSLLEEAMQLAQKNKQFGPGDFTAEAYHYWAQYLGDNVDQNTLCMIVRRDPDPNDPSQLIGEADQTNPRHMRWVADAQAELDSHGWVCLPQ
ncbi:MAG: hypothetical protein GC179_08800 [Anaerolineaceae bacterium]|nr:hypothetical protein [Anaerolineaceae bacterium]